MQATTIPLQHDQSKREQIDCQKSNLSANGPGAPPNRLFSKESPRRRSRALLLSRLANIWNLQVETFQKVERSTEIHLALGFPILL